MKLERMLQVNVAVLTVVGTLLIELDVSRLGIVRLKKGESTVSR